MEEIQNEAVESPVVEETTETTSESTEETIVAPEAESEEIKALHGVAEDGTIYTAESPAVIAFKKHFLDGTEMEAIIGSVVLMHNTIAKGETPAGENIESIIALIQGNLPVKE